MDQKALREAIASLHAELADTSAITPELRAELQSALQDVERALGRTEATRGERLEGLAARFEAEHPALSESIARLARLLSLAGI